MIGCGAVPGGPESLALRIVPIGDCSGDGRCMAEVWLDNRTDNNVQVGQLSTSALMSSDYLQTYVFAGDTPVVSPTPLGIEWPFSAQCSHGRPRPGETPASDEHAIIAAHSKVRITTMGAHLERPGQYRMWAILFVPCARDSQGQLGWAWGGNPGFQLRSNEVKVIYQPEGRTPTTAGR